MICHLTISLKGVALLVQTKARQLDKHPVSNGTAGVWSQTQSDKVFATLQWHTETYARRVLHSHKKQDNNLKV